MSNIDWERMSRWYSTSSSSPTETEYFKRLFYENERLKEIDAVYNNMKYYSRGLATVGDPLVTNSSTVEDHPDKSEDDREFMFDPKDLDI